MMRETQPGNTNRHGHGRYTHGHERAVLDSHGARTAENSVQYLLDVLEPGMSVLEVGFGPATITLDLAEAVAPGIVTAIENTEGPFAVALENAAARGDTTTQFVLADVMKLPFADDSFDIVHAHQVLQHLTDPVGALREMARVCKPDGLIAVRDADYAAMAWYPELPSLETWRALYRQIAKGNGAEPDAGRFLRAWLRKAGITEYQISSSNWSYADDEATSWWGNSQAARVSGPAFVEQAAKYGVNTAQVADIAATWRTWGADPDAWFLIPNVEILAHKPGSKA